MMTYKKTILLSLLMLVGMGMQAQQVADAELVALSQWQAGQTVSVEAVKAFGGLDSCFLSQPIPDAVWMRMQGKTFKPNPHIGRSDLRHVKALHIDIEGHTHIGEMVCNKLIADRVVGILRTLYEQHYPIERMVLPDEYDANDEQQMRANNSSCFCYRVVSGSTSLSLHARGLAIDINTLYNPYIRYKKNGARVVEPATGKPYCDRKKQFPYKIERGDLCFRLFAEQGFKWGGDWKTVKDYQHFEYKP
jgi:hypothetical protein